MIRRAGKGNYNSKRISPKKKGSKAVKVKPLASINKFMQITEEEKVPLDISDTQFELIKLEKFVSQKQISMIKKPSDYVVLI